MVNPKYDELEGVRATLVAGRTTETRPLRIHPLLSQYSCPCICWKTGDRYWCVAWILNAKHYGALHTAHFEVLRRVIRFQRQADNTNLRTLRTLGRPNGDGEYFSLGQRYVKAGSNYPVV